MSEASGKMSFGNGIPDSKLRTEYTSVSITPPDSPAHACKIALPRNAESAAEIQPEKIKAGLLTVMSGFFLPPDGLVQVSGTILPYEINLVDWLDFETQRRGGKLQALESVVGENGQVVHATGSRPDGSHQRLLVRNNGKNVLLLAGQVPAGGEPLTREKLGLAAASLELLLPLHQKLLEPLRQWRDAGGRYQFSYPSSWSARALAPPQTSMSAVDIRIADERDTIAYVRVECDQAAPTGSDGAAMLKQHLSEELKQAGVVIGAFESLGALSAKPKLERFVTTCKLPAGEGFVAMATEPSNAGWFGIVLICPGREINPLAWMRGKRAFEIITATLSEG